MCDHEGMAGNLALDPKKTALVLIDLQHMIVGRPTAPRTGAEVVANASKLVNAFHEASAYVVFVRVAFSHDRGEVLRPDVDEPQGGGGGAPAANGFEIVPELDVRPGDLLLTKHQWGAFYGTELDLQLRRRGIDTIVLGGISTNIGVESTARDAFERGYQQVFVEDAMAALAAEAHENTLKFTFPRIGRIRTTEEVISVIGG